MNVLVINCGSSSLKYQLINSDTEDVLAKGLCERIGIDGRLVYQKAGLDKEITECAMPTHKEAIQFVLDALTNEKTGAIKSLKEVDAIGHRVVHGGEKFAASAVITDEMIAAVKECNDLAPLHNPANLIGIDVCSELMPGVPQVGVFDTAFHQTMPPKAFMFGLPYDDYQNLHVRKYGFHGTSHRFVSAALAEAMGRDIKDLKIVSCHLGNGSSITAVDGGKSIDTSMGFTPLDGVVMGTRTGAVDPSAVTFVADKHHFTPSEMSEYMNKKSGFLGVSGIGSDNRDVQAASLEGNKRAKLVSDMLVYEIKKYIGSYAAAMNGLDAVLFTGGIGENSYEVREGVCEDMDYFGIKIDKELNRRERGKLVKISTPDSKVEVWIVPTNEELLIARDTLALISK